MKINDINSKLEKKLNDLGFIVRVRFFIKDKKISFLNISGSLDLLKIWNTLNEDLFYIEQVSSVKIYTLKKALPKVKLYYKSKNREEREIFKKIEERIQTILDDVVDQYLEEI